MKLKHDHLRARRVVPKKSISIIDEVDQAPVTLLPHYAERVGTEVAASEMALLAEALLGLITSCECPGHVLLETLDRVSEWGTVGRVIVSGFH